MKRLLAILLSVLLLGSLLALPVSALSYYVSHYEENIYAGGTVDLYAYPNVGNPEDYTYQWQYDAGFGGNSSWYDVPENSSYSGGKTNHLQIRTTTGVYDGWDAIPFQCVVTASDGTVRKTDNITVEIYPTEKLIPNMKNWGYGLYAPHVTNAIDMYTKDEVNYTASTYAGTKLQMFIGSKSIDDKPVLRKSEVNLKTEIHITENGHTTISTNNTSYIPYTVGQLKVEFKQKLTIGKYDLGYFDTKTVNVTVSKPTTRMTAQAKSDCSLLRYTYNESQKLASISKGATLNIVGEDGSYYQVYHNGYVGYVGKSHVSSTTDATGKLITEVDLTIPRPVAGQNPSSTCTVETATCQLYHTDPVTWTDESGKIMKTTDRFQEGKRYTVSIWLVAKSGYQFPTDASGNPKLSAAINGDLPPYIHKAYEQDPREVIELTYTFGSTPKPSDTPVPTEPAHTHTPSAWRTTGMYHYKVCTECGDMLDQEDHKGGKATCTEKAKCQVCGTAYGQNEPEHTWSPTYLYQTSAGHAWICAVCKEHSTVIPHEAGPAGTPDVAVVCKDCGYIITPAKDHKHNLTKVAQVPATCLNPGTIEYYTCDGCSDKFADPDGNTKIPENMSLEIGALGHSPAERWKKDTQYHWHICTTCGQVLDETKMLHEFEEDSCTTCGYRQGDPIEANTPEKNPQRWLFLAVVGVIAAGAGIGLAVILTKKKS